MIKVLLYSTISSQVNPYVRELEIIFRNMGMSTQLGKENFWNKTGDFDVILFQWPEELFNWRPPAESDLKKLDSILRYWAKRSKIILTRHNIEPHINSNDLLYGKLYDLMYSYADAVIHLGEFSRDEYLSQYSGQPFTARQQQAVIPHPVYTSFENSSSKEESRYFLKLPKDRKIILVFGRIRNKEELALIRQSFGRIKTKGVFMLISHYPLPVFRGSERMKPGLQLVYSRLKDQKRFFGNIPKEHIQYFLNASDMLFIPRIDTLNSGNVFLGFAYHKPVVGPDITNIGQILRKTNNHTFDPRNPGSAAIAIDLTLFENLHREEVQHNVTKNYPSNSKIGRMYEDLYTQLLGVETIKQ